MATHHNVPAAAAVEGREPRRGQLAAQLAAARRALAAEARSGRGGRAAQAAFAEAMDEIVGQLAVAARPFATTAVAVCALGGYGRRTLCLHSDVDLLLLFDGPIGEGEERFVKAVLAPLWDLQLVIGHHVRELADFDGEDVDNTEFVLALADARLVSGDGRLLEQAQGWRRGLDAASRGRVRDALLDLFGQRYRQFNDTIYQLEPDVKNAPGGLRDIAAARYLRALDPDVFAAEPARAAATLDDSEELFLRIRSMLHAESGRDANLLTHDLQERVAEALAFDGDGIRQQVEALMGAYFRAARSVARTLSRAERLSRPPAPPSAVRRAGRHFEIGPDGIRFLDIAGAASRPALWLEIFRLALAHGCPVSEQALDVIELHVVRCTADDFTATEGERLQLRNLLEPRPGLYARLSEMHDCGLLDCLFPEFAGVHGRVVRDFYHRYTVDEHTLLAVRNLESLVQPATPARKRFASLLDEIRHPELLTLALLLHDVGKWRDSEHAQESARLAAAALDRLELPDDARHAVEFLVLHHLQMSQIAFRRDLEDPRIVAQFARLVGTEEHLKMLCLLTLADIGAVSPTTLTPWKEELLWRLYVDTYNHLTLGYADELVMQDPAGLAVVVAGRPDDISELELTRFLEGLPRRYIALFGLASIYRHVRLARGIEKDEIHTFLENHDDVWELTIVTLDKPFLFSNVSGVLSYFGMDIHRGQAMTTPDGLVLDVFEFSDGEGFLRQNPGAPAEISRMLDRVVAGWVDVPSLLRGKERSVVHRRRRRVRPHVHVDNEHSHKYTVLEIVADDATGLLYRISRVLSEQGCDLDLVLIATEGKKAIDVLHVTTEGRKLVESEQTRVRQALEDVLEAVDETR